MEHELVLIVMRQKISLCDGISVFSISCFVLYWFMLFTIDMFDFNNFFSEIHPRTLYLLCSL